MGYGPCSYYLDDLAIPAHGILPGWPRWLRTFPGDPFVSAAVCGFFAAPDGTLYAFGETSGGVIGFYRKPKDSVEWEYVDSNIDVPILYAGLVLSDETILVAGGQTESPGVGTNVFKSADGGITFAEIDDLGVGPDPDIRWGHSGAVYNGAAIVVAYTDVAWVSRSLDLGLNWEAFAIPLPYTEQPVLGVGRFGRVIMASSNIRTSDDNGETWTPGLLP